MNFDLKSVKGISNDAVKKLVNLGIDDGDKLRSSVETAEQRTALAQKINLSVNDIYIWSKQAELMQVEGISAEDAQLLLQCGIRDLPDLVAVEPDSLLKFMKTVGTNTVGGVKRIPCTEEIKLWQEKSKQLVSGFQRDANDDFNEFLAVAKPGPTVGFNNPGSTITVREAGFFSDLTKILTEIGAGIAGAQHQMDLSSLDIQNRILEDEELAATGFNATWYTIPEVNFTLKMEYAVAEETTTSSSGLSSTIRKMYISPSNARYNNIFKSSQSGESSLGLRIVPVPPPERFTERRVMPNLLGLTKEEAEEELTDNGITLKAIQVVTGKTANGKATEVTEQSIPEGKVLLINEQPELKVTMNETE